MDNIKKHLNIWVILKKYDPIHFKQKNNNNLKRRKLLKQKILQIKKTKNNLKINKSK